MVSVRIINSSKDLRSVWTRYRRLKQMQKMTKSKVTIEARIYMSNDLQSPNVLLGVVSEFVNAW